MTSAARSVSLSMSPNFRKHDIVKKVGAIFGHAYDEMTRRTTSVMLDEAAKHANALPVKVANASKT